MIEIRNWKKGQTGSGVKGSGLQEKMTTPPRPYDEASLLADMERAARFIEDPVLRESMKLADGMGTPATRAAILEKLKGKDGRGKPLPGESFIREEKGKLRATPYADKVVALFEKIGGAPGGVVDPAMTAIWEAQLKAIEEGTVAFQSFMAKQEQFVRECVNAADSVTGQFGTPCSSVGCDKGGSLRRAKGKTGHFWVCSKRGDGCQCRIGDNKGKPVLISKEAPQPVEPMDGDGQPCPKCKKGSLKTLRANNPKSKVCGKRFLRCSDDKCDYLHGEWEDEREPVDPLPGDGESCPTCKKGTLVTRVVTKEGSSVQGKRFIACSDRACKHMRGEWEDERPDVEPMPGDGEACPTCKKGTLVTRLITKKESRAYGKRFLACSVRECRHMKGEWEDERPDVEPMPGDGEVCPTCKKGKLVTRMVMKKESRAYGKRFIACSDRACKHMHGEWEDEKS